MDLEDALPYDEPWGWMVPSRHALAALLCDAADAAAASDATTNKAGSNDRAGGAGAAAGSASAHLKEAEDVCRADLVKRPNNLWALKGLARAMKAQVRRIGW